MGKGNVQWLYSIALSCWIVRCFYLVYAVEIAVGYIQFDLSEVKSERVSDKKRFKRGER